MSGLLLGFLGYLAVMLAVGVWAYRHTTTQSGFLLGDRKLGPWVIAFSERASGESAWLLVGLPGVAFAAGFLELWTAIGCCCGILASWYLVAPRLRAEVGRSGSMTLPDYFRTRFPSTHGSIRIVASIIIAFFFTLYVAAQFNGAGKVLDTTFGEALLSLQSFFAGYGLQMETTTIGMILGTIIVIFYTAMGGFLAVALTDFVQAILMLGTLVVLPIVAFFHFGGTEQLLPAIAKEGAEMLSVTGGRAGWDAVIGIIGGLSWGLGYMGQPHILTRFMAMRSEKDIRKGRLIAIWWAVPAFWGAFLLGIIGLGAYGSGYFEDPERLMPFMATTLLPGWLAGIFISGAIAAMMSTADSQLLVTTSTLSEDIWHKALKQKSSPESLARFSRIATVGVGIVALVLAIRSQEQVFEMVSYAWSGLAAAFAPGLLLTLWWKRTTGTGVLAGMIGGTITVVLWKQLGWDAWLTERVSGVAVAALLIGLVSLIWPSNREGPSEV